MEMIDCYGRTNSLLSYRHHGRALRQGRWKRTRFSSAWRAGTPQCGTSGPGLSDTRYPGRSSDYRRQNRRHADAKTLPSNAQDKSLSLLLLLAAGEISAAVDT